MTGLRRWREKSHQPGSRRDLDVAGAMALANYRLSLVDTEHPPGPCLARCLERIETRAWESEPVRKR